MSSDTPRTAHRTCPLCEAMCGLALTIDGDQVGVVRGDRDDPFSKGFVCPKGTTLGRLHHDPDRLTTPLVRSGVDESGAPVFDEVSWDEAFARVAELVAPILGGSRQRFGLYLGNPNVHNLANTIYTRPLIKALGTSNIFSASTVDQMPRHASCGHMYGDPLAIPVPDLDRTDHLLMLGANPWASNGSLCTAADFPGRLTALVERGGELVVVDPRRSRTSEAATEHLSIVPGTDALWLAALAWVLIDEDLVDLGPSSDHLSWDGLLDGSGSSGARAGSADDALAALGERLSTFTPEAVAEVCGIDAETTRRHARSLAAADTAVVYGRIGVHTTEFGTLGSWLADLLTILTGNLDTPGGLMWSRAMAGPRPATTGGRGFATGRRRSRVHDRPEVLGEFPVADLADEILTDGDDRIRVLFCIAGNPALSTPDSGRLAEALGDLDALISIDPYLNETSRHAQVILPPPTPLQKSHFDIAFNRFAVRNVAKWTAPIFEPSGPGEDEIMARLAMIVSGEAPDADPTLIHELVLGTVIGGDVGRPGSPIEGRDVAEVAAECWGPTPPDRVLDAMIRLGPHGDGFGADPDGWTLERLAEHPHGVDLGPLEPSLPGVLRTPSFAVEVAPAVLVADLDRMAERLDQPTPDLLLVGRRHLRSNNSWMHNVEVLVKGKPRCTLQVHPDDAERLGLGDGRTAEVTSPTGTVTAPVEVTEAVSRGVVSLPHGWGHDAPGVRMSVAERHAGVNSNVLTPTDLLDPLSGTASLNAIPVEVSPV